MEKEKPVIVRVKRKQFQEPLDAFWLEISERPVKRPLLDIGSLSISGSGGKEDAKYRKVFVQHVETVSSSEVAKNVVESFLPDSANTIELRKKIEERRQMLRQNNEKRYQLCASAKHNHEAFARSARFEQIWKSRRGQDQRNDKLHEICNLYDVVRIDSEDDIHNDIDDARSTTSDNAVLLSNFLPLLREFLPTAATEIESDLVLKQDNYVYDIYTVEDDISETDANTVAEYPLVQVNDANEFYDGPSGSEYDSEDSNAENRELHDYPDEESSEDDERSGKEEHGTGSESDDIEASGYGYEEEIACIDDDEMEELIWRYR